MITKLYKFIQHIGCKLTQYIYIYEIKFKHLDIKEYKYYPRIPKVIAPKFLPYKEWMFIPLFRNFTAENKNNIELYLQELLKNLDKKSKKCAITIWNRYTKYLPTQKTPIIKRNKLFSRDELKEQKKIIGIFHEFIKPYKLPQNMPYEIGVFYYQHGLNKLTPKELMYIANSDFMDFGAYIGDSAILMNQYNPKRIFSFEIDENNYDNLLETIKLNSLENKIIPLLMGISDKTQTVSTYGDRAATTLFEINNKRYFLNKKINCDTIDNIVKEYDIEPKFFKFDIEGYELKAIKGAIQTIKKYRPIMIISIYHSPEDFLFIKPIIENLNLGYKFKIEKHTPFDPVYETVLIAIPQIDSL